MLATGKAGNQERALITSAKLPAVISNFNLATLTIENNN